MAASSMTRSSPELDTRPKTLRRQPEAVTERILHHKVKGIAEVSFHI